MTLELDARIRSVVDLMADSGREVPEGSKGVVIGFAGERLVVRFDDPDTDTSETAVAEVWELRPL